MSVEYKDYYRILGVDRHADSRAIEAAYRRQIRLCDMGGVAVQARRAAELDEALAVLSDPISRQEYDYTAGPIVWMHARRGKPRSLKRRARTLWEPVLTTLRLYPRRPALSSPQGAGTGARRAPRAGRTVLVCGVLLGLATQQWLSHTPSWQQAAAPRHDTATQHRPDPGHTATHLHPRPQHRHTLYLYGVCVTGCRGAASRR